MLTYVRCRIVPRRVDVKSVEGMDARELRSTGQHAFRNYFIKSISIFDCGDLIVFGLLQ